MGANLPDLRRQAEVFKEDFISREMYMCLQSRNPGNRQDSYDVKTPRRIAHKVIVRDMILSNTPADSKGLSSLQAAIDT